MAKYEALAREANKIVEDLIKKYNMHEQDIVALGHLVNLSVRAHPRPCQGTVRKNIVNIATGDHCGVNMVRRSDPVSGKEYNVIDIYPSGSGS